MIANPGASASNLNDVINDAPISGFQIRVFLLCSLVTFLDGYDLQSLALAIPSLGDEFHAAPAAFAAAITASLIGMTLGSMLLSPLADRWGRRPLLIAFMSLIGLAALGTLTISSRSELMFWRFFAGLGLGASVPVAVAMTAEYAPLRRRAALVTIMICCTSLGAFAGGIGAPALEHVWGWRGIFRLGAGLSLGAAALLWAALPESIYFLSRTSTEERTRNQLARIVPDLEDVTLAASPASGQRRASLKSLFSASYRRRTVLLWTMFWCSVYTAYSLISWLPTLLRGAGWAHDQAQRMTGLLAIGGIAGGLLQSWFADRFKSVTGLAVGYAITAVVFTVFAFMTANPTLWIAFVLFAGMGSIGGNIALGAVSATFYSVELRSTGLGWSNGVGRAGGICGPVVAAMLMKSGHSSVTILSLLAIPMLICACCGAMLPRALRVHA